MAFERVRSHRKPSTNGVRVAVRKIAATPLLKVVVSLGPDVLAKTAWIVGQELEVLRGTDGDLGKMLLRAGDCEAEGYRLRKFGETKNGDKLSIAIWLWDELPNEKQRVTECKWKFGPDGLLITLPAWAGRPPKRFEDAAPVKPVVLPAAKPYPAFA